MQNLVSFKVSNPKSRFTNNYTQTIVEINVKGFTHTVYLPGIIPFINERLNLLHKEFNRELNTLHSLINVNNANKLLSHWVNTNLVMSNLKSWDKVQDLLFVLKEFNMVKNYSFTFYQKAYDENLRQPYFIGEVGNGKEFCVMQKETAERVWSEEIEKIAKTPKQENFMYDVTDVGMWFGAEEYALVRNWYVFIK